MPGPTAEYLFEREPVRLGGAIGTRNTALMSVVSHVGFLLLILLVARLVPKQVYQQVLPETLSDKIVWLADPGPGGGGGGGGNKMPDPPKEVALKAPEVSKPQPKPEPPKIEPEPVIPAQINAEAPPNLGVVDAPPTPTASQGAGVNDGAGSGRGTGIGSGTGSGLGEGSGGGTGGGVYRPGNGVTIPRVVREVKPQYTAEAMRAKVQGTVLLNCVVMTDGSVGKVDIVKSLDSTFGLDQEAIKAAKQWRFAPGTRLGEPVAVLVTIQLDFALR